MHSRKELGALQFQACVEGGVILYHKEILTFIMNEVKKDILE